MLWNTIVHAYTHMMVCLTKLACLKAAAIDATTIALFMFHTDHHTWCGALNIHAHSVDQ